MMTAISRWPDADRIVPRLEALAREPARTIRRDRMAEVLAWFDRRCSGSRALVERARRLIPGGVQHNLAFNHPFPLAIARADGPYLFDVDGNSYTDLLQSGGATLLGSNWRPVRAQVLELLDACGPVTGLFHEYELKLAEVINRHLPSVELFRMLGSGTEGIMAAIRAARTFTDKAKVIKAGGAYHGWSDQMVYGLHIPGTGALEAFGIPRGCNKDTQEFPPGDLEGPKGLRALLQKNRDRGGTAAVIVEPLGPESGTRPVRADFNQGVRALCDEFGALLIFDEVVTGFRMGLGGAQGYLGVRPDLTVFGKCVAGGYPGAGGLGGRRDVMSCLAAGLEAGKPRAYVGGTLAANPLSCVAGYHTILEIERTQADVVAGRAGDRLTAGLERLIEQHHLPFVAYNQGSICHLQTSAALFVDLASPDAIREAGERKHLMEELGAALTAEGVIPLAGSRLITSLADNDEVVDEALRAFDRIFGSFA